MADYDRVWELCMTWEELIRKCGVIPPTRIFDSGFEPKDPHADDRAAGKVPLSTPQSSQDDSRPIFPRQAMKNYLDKPYRTTPLDK